MEAAVRWSPHSTGDRQRFLVVDVSDSSLVLNEVDHLGRNDIQYHAVTRYAKLPNYAAFAWSPISEPIVALGLVSGNASLIRLGEGKQISETVATFKVKQQRRCNSVAFSSDNWLAVALDKIRSDVCLNIYDANVDAGGSPEPVRKLCAAELVSSVRFFPSKPQELVAATQRAFIRLYDLRDGYYGSGGTGNLQSATRNVNNIAIDSFDENYFASAGSTGDPSFTIWDKRWMTQTTTPGSNNGAIFNFLLAGENVHPTTIRSLRWSEQRRGRIALCMSTGKIKVIDVKNAQSSPLQQSDYLPVNPYGGTPWHTNRYVAQTRTLESPWLDPVRATPKLIAFDWVKSGDETSSSQLAAVMRPDREVAVLSVPIDSSSANVTAREDIVITSDDLSVTETTVINTAAKASVGISTPEDFGPHYDLDGSVDDTEEGGPQRLAIGSEDLAHVLISATVQRERCRQGYLFDCDKNSRIVAGHWQIERLWEIARRFRQQAAGNGMVYESLDLSYLGVASLWTERIGNIARRSISPTPLPVADAIAGLTGLKAIPSFEGERTRSPDHRQLCLAVCGWKFTKDTLQVECQELVDRGLYYQAIVQSVLHEQKHLALNILRSLIRSKTVPNIGLGALLASDDINEEQREMCLWMAADTDDPALKALLVYLTNGDWRDVMKTNYLHLGYRIALGLKYLNDTELSGYLQAETARAVRNGDLEGVLLTGLGEQAMDLLQTYLTKTGDIQTAVLASAFTNPRYVDDVRWEMWKETYFEQMQSWKAFSDRTKFTVQHNRFARIGGKSLMQQNPAQVTLRCNHCGAGFGRRDGKTEPANSDRERTRISGPAAHAGTVCLDCGRHMPRCGICMLWLGTADSAKHKAVKELSKAEDMMAKFTTFCVRCGHGYHAHHAREWFGKHEMCAVSDCRCVCGLRG